MPKRKLSNYQKFRKATLKQFLRDKARTRADKKKNADRDLVSQWRALRKAGAYNTEESPSLSRLTKYRRREIQRKFSEVQELSRYEKGEAYRPFHKREYETTRTIRDPKTKKILKTQTRINERYELDTDHFQLVKGKAKQKPGDSIKVDKGYLVAKSPNEKITITKDGKIKVTEKIAGVKTEFTREPLSGPLEFIQLLEDIKGGRIKFKKNEGLVLLSNGKREKPYYGTAGLNALAKRLEYYLAGGLVHALGKGGGAGNFDDWANSSLIYKVTRK